MSEDDLNKPANKESRVAILDAIKNTTTLLALVLLVGEATILAAMGLTPKDQQMHGVYTIAMIALLVIVVIGIFFDRFQDKKFATKSDISISNQDNESDQEDEPVDPGKDPLLKEIVANVNESRKYMFRVFQEQIDIGLSDFLIRTKNWRQGELKVLPKNYSSVLLDLYSKAEESIFSTTNKSYIDSWDPDLMKRMMKASSESKANSVTRVFVFDNRKVINQTAIDVIRSFEENKSFNVRIYLDDEDKAYHFPSDISRDFVMIDDGGAIGITDFVDKEKGEKGATWYIQDKYRTGKFNSVVKALMDGSKSAKKIIDWWEKDGKLNAQENE